MKIAKDKLLVILGVIIIVYSVGLTIGYSSFGSNLMATNIAAKVRLEEVIRVTDFSVAAVDGEAYSFYNEYNIDRLSSKIVLPSSSSAITYNVSVTNFGNVDMGLVAIEDLPSNLEVNISNYQYGEKISKLGGKVTFSITVKYRTGETLLKEEIPINLKFNFKPFYSINYVNIEDKNYPKEIIADESLEISFLEGAPYEVAVHGESAEVTFTYIGGVLKIDKVTSNLIIEGIDRVFNEDFVIDADEEEFLFNESTTISDLLEREFSGVNATDTKITKVEVIIDYKSHALLSQSVNINLKNDQNTSTTTARFSLLADSVSITFDDILILPGEEFAISIDERLIFNHNIDIYGMKLKIYFE